MDMDSYAVSGKMYVVVDYEEIKSDKMRTGDWRIGGFGFPEIFGLCFL